MGVIFDGVVWAGLAMIWTWPVGVASVLELVFKKLEPMAGLSLHNRFSLHHCQLYFYTITISNSQYNYIENEPSDLSCMKEASYR